MKIQIIDAHTHVNFAAFKNDWQQVIEKTLANGIGLINVGSQKDTSKKAIEIANQYDYGVWAAVGLHPIHADEENFDYEYYKNLAKDPKAVAIGETGLDYYRFKDSSTIGRSSDSRKDIETKQKRVFIEHIKLAKEVGKPLMIHCRDGYEDLLDILKTNSSLLGPHNIIHFFSGDEKNAQVLLEMGFYFTFGGVITFTRAYDEIIKKLPLERILLETDAPYVAPEPYRGKRNEPAYIIEIAKKLASLKNMPLEETMERVLQNSKSVFRI